MEFLDLAERFGPWAALLVYVLWSQRDRIGALFDRRARLAERDREQDLAFEEQARRRLLNGDEQLRAILQAEQTERRALTRTAIEQAQAAERLASASVEVMQDFADIARLQTDRLDEMMREIGPVIRETKGVMEALWFLMVRQVQRQDESTANELIQRTEGDRGH